MKLNMKIIIKKEIIKFISIILLSVIITLINLKIPNHNIYSYISGMTFVTVLYMTLKGIDIFFSVYRNDNN